MGIQNDVSRGSNKFTRTPPILPADRLKAGLLLVFISSHFGYCWSLCHFDLLFFVPHLFFFFFFCGDAGRMCLVVHSFLP